MKFTKPSWVIHKDFASRTDTAPAKRLSIFSVHVHPDGSRIATGGLDSRVRIWSTKPILNPASEASGKPPKSLCTLTMHTGPVLVVRWAHSGKWLASGSDDEIVMVWDLDPSARGKVWGSDEVNVEGWKPLKRLPGHESDVTDVAWSPGDRYLASVGLDSKVLIWCGFTLERLHKLDQHQGFVKGVCWDPVGEFLATQSDDRSVKIWRTKDWKMEAEITKPFEDSPGSTFFRRLSWSPDGAHITASNATNSKGFVFTAAVITRGTWTSDISLVGHENTVEVAAYNPHIFLRDPSMPLATANICSVVALGADDCSVSVWQTKSARPLIVAREVFERQIMDLSWSWDGLTLYAASSDGTLAVFDFDKEELEGISPHSSQEQYLKKFNFVPPPVPEGYSHHRPQESSNVSSSADNAMRITPPPSPKGSSQNGFGPVPSTSVNGGEKINVLVAKKKDKRRANLFAAPPSASQPAPSASTPAIPTASTSRQHPISQSISQAAPQSSASNTTRRDVIDVDMDSGNNDHNPSISAIDASSPSMTGKRKQGSAGLDDVDEPKAQRPRTLGGDKPRSAPGVVKQLDAGADVTSAARSMIGEGVVQALRMMPLLTYIKAEPNDRVGQDTVLVEGRNPSGEEAASPEVTYIVNKQTQWLDYLPSPVLGLTVTSHFVGVSMRDGGVNVYSLTGRRLMPTLTLGSSCHAIESNKWSLMIVTCSGQLYSWNVKKQTAIFSPVSLSPLLSSINPNVSLVSATVRPNGLPILVCSNHVAYTYNPSLSTFTKLSEMWWSEGSDSWQGRQRSTGNAWSTNVVSTIESALCPPDETNAFTYSPSKDRVPRPEWWTIAMTLGHLESRMQAAKALESPQEYKQALQVYAKRIADEAFRAKAEELIKELFGPVYWRPGKEGDDWNPSIAGLMKRDLLKDVLSIFAKSKTLTKLAQDWQDTLKKAMNGNDE